MGLRTSQAGASLGGKLGPRLAALISKAAAAHLQRTGHTRARIHAAGLDLFHRQIGDELRGNLAAVLGSVAKDLPDSNPHKALLEFLAAQPGEGAAITALLGGGTALGTALSSGLANVLAPLNQNIMWADPNSVLPPQTAAAAVAAQVTDEPTASNEARFSGLSRERFDQLLQLAYNWGDLGTLQSLGLRGLLDWDTIKTHLRRNGYPEILINGLADLSRVPLAPAQLADMVLRGWLSQEEGASKATWSGTTPEDFDLLVKDTGEPPGLMQLLEAYRRGFIPRERLEHGIRESRVRDEWIDVVERLRFAPMSTADAARAYVEGYLSYDDGAAIAQQNGLEPAHWQFIAESWGRPLAHEQMLTLYHRGQASREQVDAAFRQSDVKPQYEEQSFELGRRMPAERMVVEMIRHNAISTQDGLTLLLEDGYSPADAAAIVRTGTAQRTAAHREIAKGDLLAMYAQGVISQADVETHLQTLGYSADDARLIMSLERAKLLSQGRKASIAKVRSGFDGHKIDAATAQNQLLALGVDHTQVAELMANWEIERQANRRGLTEAQVLRAHKLGAITDDDALSRLQALGLEQADATLLLTIAG